MESVTVRDLRNHSAELLARVARGESLTVTRDGRPVAMLSPLPVTAASTKVLIGRRQALPRVNSADLRADIGELVDQTMWVAP